MTITSVAEWEQARAVLTGRPAAELADFILSLAVPSDGISEYVHAFALAANTKAAAEVLSLDSCATESETATTDTGKAQGMWLVPTDG